MIRSFSLSVLFSASCLLLASIAPEPTSAQVGFHGSGSSAVSMCLWHMVETLSAETKIPIWASYRSIGSGSGVDELMGNGTHPFNDFAGSDFPLPKEEFDALAAAGKEVVHLPAIMGSIGVFDSVPKIGQSTFDESGEDISVHINLTACLLARIYQGEIDVWTHPEILEINPNMELPVQLDFYGNPKADQSYPMKVAYRALSSGTTFIFTSYLGKACPEHWGPELVGSEIEWPIAGKENSMAVEGTSEMTAALKESQGVIGYADSGAALDQGLAEIALKMEQTTLKDDFFLTSENAQRKDGIAAAVNSAGIPESADMDFSQVDTVNRVDGYIYAWPMVFVTYVVVRKDLSTFMPDPRSQSLLVAFLKGMYDDTITEKCAKDFLLLPVKDVARDVGLAGIDMLEVSTDAPDWIIETSVLDNGVGQGDYVISTRRQRSSAIQQDILTDKINHAEATLEGILQNIEKIDAKTTVVEQELLKVSSGGFGVEDSILEKENRIDASFIMAIMSLVLWFVSAIVLCNQQSRLRTLETRRGVEQAITITTKKKKRSSRDAEERGNATTNAE